MLSGHYLSITLLHFNISNLIGTTILHWGDRPQAGNALCLETSWGWKELWVGFYSWLDTPEKKIHGFRLEMALGWKPPWAGNNFRLEAALAWKQLQAGSNLRLETALGWKQLQAGSNLRLETALGWKRCRAYVCLEIS